MSNSDECCLVCFRRVGINAGDDGSPPVDLGRCAATDGFECRAVGQAVAGYRRENEVLRSNCDHLSSENASLSSQVESMALRIESLADTRRCAPCGKVYTMAEWLALPGAAGGSRMELSPGEWLELRNCACGGTMAEPGRPDVRRIRDRLGEIYVALVRLADTYASDDEKRASQEFAARVLRECRPKP